MDISETSDIPSETTRVKYKLHSMTLRHGGNRSDTSPTAGHYQHYSLIVRQSRKWGWIRLEMQEMLCLFRWQRQIIALLLMR